MKNRNNFFLTTGDIASYFHVTVNTVKKWIGDGKLKAFLTPGGHYRITEEEFERFKKRFHPSSGSNRILVVDDDPIYIKMIVDALSTIEKDYIIDTSTDGYEAMIKIGEFNPNLLIIDIRMPRLDGRSVIKSLRSNPLTKNIKIIVVSAYPQDLGKEKRYVHALLSKPVDLEFLREKVKEII